MVRNYDRRMAMFEAAAEEYTVLARAYNASIMYKEGNHPDLWNWLFYPQTPVYIPRRPDIPTNLTEYPDWVVMPIGQQYPLANQFVVDG